MKLIHILYAYFALNILLFIPLTAKFIAYCEINKEKCTEHLPNYFMEATLIEVDKRLTDNNVRRVKNYSNDKPKPEYRTLTSSAGTIKLKKTKEYEEKSLEEKSAMLAQTVMAWKKMFLQINDLDSIWNDMLRQQNIYMETGVKYRHCDQAETIYSNKDSLFFKTAVCLDEYRTGFFEEISLHGYYKVSFKTLYYYSPNKFNKLFLMGLGLVLSLIICCWRIVKSIRIKLTPLAKPEPEDEFLRIRKSTSYPITDTISLDMERNLLWATDGREVDLTNKMMEFMEELLESPYFHALNKDLWKNIWNTEEDTSNVLTQLVSNLRDELRRFPELELRNIRKKGYRLIILPKEKHPKTPAPPDEKK